MPRNSIDNSYERFIAVENFAKLYSLKDKYLKKNKLSKADKVIYKQISKISKAYNVLCDPYQTILRNTFFEKKELYWWIDYYSKTTYYRLRSKAIKTFLLAYELQ